MIDNGVPALFDTIEESVILTAFASCHQNPVQTAKTLGISRNILRTHLKRFSLIGNDAGPGSATDDGSQNLAEQSEFAH